ncbi:type 1 fimbrial protein [Xenorhabdus bovienii]|uniref:type 1 fimbrial protein n=2 Tax=Xenorhabdus bovienii TaxID=40576 RepID=UPI00237CB8B2|nr:type 1 fimbrial protein [Xenorhabdus bovienii]MDE1481238.1 type 1 fimbrial protein [Xenorhabdus bovienii]MDE9431090.1 type 1 fimbrial protein [Xenorhabdus bovienii]MDE9440201.1 type 1 fimbrial protein [Xenorhabdus bovienii]MDE9488734.1 type 1 fimbrial protein [Xenorhabdus bovienii]MDE9505115.1 type 1 fimbrial protein [Xenorhabdus bovienii]
MQNYLKLLISCLLVSWMSYGYAQPTGGQIQFSGSIVDPGCQVVVSNTQANISCYRLGKSLTVKQIISTQKTIGEVMLPGNIGVSSVKWTDSQKRVAIINVDYF